jgi:hypothetical protein
MNNRPKIPEAVRRRVRQRCLFGCRVCGVALFHYDHIEEYAEVLAHTADDITLLCANHHQMKTSGRLSKVYFLERNANPVNRDHDFTGISPGVISPAWKVKFFAGSNTYIVSYLDGFAHVLRLTETGGQFYRPRIILKRELFQYAPTPKTFVA